MANISLTSGFGSAPAGNVIATDRILNIGASKLAPIIWDHNYAEKALKLAKMVGVPPEEWEAMCLEENGFASEDVPCLGSLFLILEKTVSRINKLQPGCMYCGEA
ncbi:MAG: hypothetical protein ACXABY_11510 [Candidatus Thorarchaeota archaeon]|jgi:hypothetical protein